MYYILLTIIHETTIRYLIMVSFTEHCLIVLHGGEDNIYAYGYLLSSCYARRSSSPKLIIDNVILLIQWHSVNVVSNQFCRSNYNSTTHALCPQT